MLIVFYKAREKPKEIDVPRDELARLVGGVMDIEEMICGTCVVWYKNAPIPKDRTKYHRNVFITKQVGGAIQSTLTPIYSDFFLCGYNNGRLEDMPPIHKTEIMALFGF